MAKERLIPESTYRKHLQRAKDGGNYFIFFRLYTKLMKRMTCLFLQDLINLGSLDNMKKKIVDGKEYFQCTVEYLEDSHLAWTVDEQRNHFAVLEEKQYVFTKRMGIPGVRWAYIDFKKLEDDLDDVLGNNSTPEEPEDNEPEGVRDETPVTGKTPNYSRSETRNYSRSKNRDKPQSDDRNYTVGELTKYNCSSPARNGETPNNLFSNVQGKQPPEHELANLLHRVLTKRGKLQGKKSDFKNWYKEFKECLEKRSYEQIHKAILWYDVHIYDQFVPKYYCARTFCGGFCKIEDAMERDGALDRPSGVTVEYLSTGKRTKVRMHYDTPEAPESQYKVTTNGGKIHVKLPRME